MDNVKVELYEDTETRLFHFEYREFKVPRKRLSVCGLNTREMRHAAWFDVGDKRGGVHYHRACPTCSASLVT